MEIVKAFGSKIKKKKEEKPAPAVTKESGGRNTDTVCVEDCRYTPTILLSSFFFPVLVWLLTVNIAHTQIPNLGPGVPEITVSNQDLLWTQTLQINNPRDENGRKSGMNVSHLYKGYVFLILGGDGHHTGPRAIELHKLIDEGGLMGLEFVKQYYSDETQMLGESHSFGFFTKDGIDYGIFHTEEGIAIWDLTDVNDFKLVSRVNIGGIFQTNYDGTAFGVFTQWPYAYVAGSNSGLRIVNIRNPEQPYVAKTLTPAEAGLTAFNGRLGFCYAIGNLLFISAVETPGWSVLDISRPSNPILMHGNSEAGLTYHANLYGDRIHVLGRLDHTLHTYKMKPMEEYVFGDEEFVVKESASLGIPRSSEYLYFNDDRLYIGAGPTTRVGKYDYQTGTYKNLSPYMFLDAGGANEGHTIPFGNFSLIGDDHGTGSGLIVTDLFPDKTPPKVVLTVPADGSTGRSIASRVGMQYSSMITVETVNSANFIVREKSTGAQVEGVYSAFQNYANFAPIDFLKRNTEYEVTVTAGITDWSGNPGVTKVFSFTTSDFDESTLPVDPDREPVDTLFTLPTTERAPMATGTASQMSGGYVSPFPPNDSLLTLSMYEWVWGAEGTENPGLGAIAGGEWRMTWKDRPPPPHNLYMQLFEPVTMTSMLHLPGKSPTGLWELYIGMDSTSATKVAEGDFLESTEMSQVWFAPVEGQYINFRILTATPNDSDAVLSPGHMQSGVSELGFYGNKTKPDVVSTKKQPKPVNIKGDVVYYNLKGKRINKHNLVPNNIYFRTSKNFSQAQKFIYSR